MWSESSSIPSAVYFTLRDNTAPEYSWLCLQTSGRNGGSSSLTESGEVGRETVCQSPAASFPPHMRANLLSTRPTLHRRQGEQLWSDGGPARGTYREKHRGGGGEWGEIETPPCLWSKYIFSGHLFAERDASSDKSALWKREISHHSSAAIAGCFGMSGYCSASAERWTRHIGAKELATCHVTEERCFATAAGCSRRQMPPLASFLACSM